MAKKKGHKGGVHISGGVSRHSPPAGGHDPVLHPSHEMMNQMHNTPGGFAPGQDADQQCDDGDCQAMGGDNTSYQD